MTGSIHDDITTGTRTLVLHPAQHGAAGANGTRSSEACLAEAAGLAEAIKLDVVERLVVPLRTPRPSTLLGKGKVEELATLIGENEIELAVMDAPLSPVQQRNLERAWKAKVIDRTALILEIFGERARTREGRLQVEMAALSYQRSRLVRSWTHLERQRGGFGFLGGPGETQIEADRRQIDERLVRLRHDLAEVARTRGLHRRARQRVPYPLVALVGYTNAGKSTLFNRLTGARVFADDQLFATLDPTLRALELPTGRKIILSDTVGFVSNLPTQLVAAFRATLEEVVEADLILHVRDVSHPDTEAQREDVLTVLRELGLGAAIDEERILEVCNKVDLLPAPSRDFLAAETRRRPDRVVVSALTGEGCPEALAAIDAKLVDGRRVVDVLVPFRAGAALDWLYRHGEVLERKDEAGGVHVSVGLDPDDLAKFQRRWNLGA